MLYHEKHRPQFHFTARQNWLNDPNGLVYYDGTYHLFFQHNPTGLEWGNMTWGHAVSRDIVRWKQVENTLEPDSLGTMFSGSAVVDWENTSGFQTGVEKPIVLIYTAAGGTSPESEGQSFTQCLACSTDGGQTWVKYPGNPVLDCVREGNRDPKVIWHAPTRRWIMTLYLSNNDFAFFSSPDLKAWTHLHDLAAPESIECPDFFELPVEGDQGVKKWVWVASNARYYVGSFDGQRFTPEQDLLIGDWGANIYACQTYSDVPRQDGRRIQITWMYGGMYPNMPFNQQMSFPCELKLYRTAGGYRLARQPIREIENLIAREFNWDDLAVSAEDRSLDGPQSGLFDIYAVINQGTASSIGILVNGEAVTYDVNTKTLNCLGRSAPLELVDDQIQLRILVDRASLEVFANNGLVSMTSCFIPSEENPGVSLFARDGQALVRTILVNELLSAWA
jgi:fructan beta-fructosidase